VSRITGIRWTLALPSPAWQGFASLLIGAKLRRASRAVVGFETETIQI